MATQIIPKKSSVLGKIPLAGDLAVGELVQNLADHCLYSKDASGNVFRIAKQAVMKAGQYAYRDRRTKKRVFRQLWIARINAAVRLFDPAFTYSRLIDGLNKAGIMVDRKVLADLAMNEAGAFSAIIAQAKAALPKAA